jgi:hypothetical protein
MLFKFIIFNLVSPDFDIFTITLKKFVLEMFMVI